MKKWIVLFCSKNEFGSIINSYHKEYTSYEMCRKGLIDVLVGLPSADLWAGQLDLLPLDKLVNICISDGNCINHQGDYIKQMVFIGDSVILYDASYPIVQLFT